MIETVRRFRYRAFGLNILSELPLPELPQAKIPPTHMNAEVIMKQTDLTKQWAENFAAESLLCY